MQGQPGDEDEIDRYSPDVVFKGRVTRSVLVHVAVDQFPETGKRHIVDGTAGRGLVQC